MTLAEQGMYLRLLCFAWREGSIPSNANALRTLCGDYAPEYQDQDFNMERLVAMFIPHPEKPDRLISRRLEIERKSMEDRAEKAKTSANTRWTGGDANAMRTHSDGSSTQQCERNAKQKQKQKQNKNTTTPYSPPGDFENFWNAYPNRKGKGAAEKAWKQIKPNESLVAKILSAIEEQKKSQAWIKDGGDFIPHPATWLNQKRWDDEVRPYRPNSTDPRSDFEVLDG